MERPIEEIKKEIRKRLEGFDIDMVRADVDSWMFGNKTMLKIEELSNEFDQALVIEVINTVYLEASEKVYPFNISKMSINGIQAQRIVNNIVKADGKEYGTDKFIFAGDSLEFVKDVSKLFDDLVIPAAEPNERFVKNVDEWIKRVHELKMKYGVPAFQIMYSGVERVRSLMWGEGFTEEDAVVEIANRQEKEMERLLSYRAQRMNQLKGSLAHFHGDVVETMKDIECNVPGSANRHYFTTDLHIGMGRGLNITTNQSSGGHGYDISTNGGRHKKVVTGKAGNRYPVAKRRGVR